MVVSNTERGVFGFELRGGRRFVVRDFWMDLALLQFLGAAGGS